MTRLRQPVSRQEVLLLVAGVALGVVLFGWAGQLSPGAALALWLAVVFVGQPISTLVHELGHAAAVTASGRRPSRVVVGRGPWIVFRLGPVAVNFSLLPMRGVLTGGFCRYDPAGLSWRALAWIALAGPIATVLALLLLLAAAPVLWASGPLGRNATTLMAFMLIASLISDLRRRPGASKCDAASLSVPHGMRARVAFANRRAGTPPPPWIGAAAAAGVASGHQSILPAHWGPDDPEQRRELDDQLRLAIGPPEPGQDPAERRRIVAQLRATLSAPDQSAPGRPAQQRDRARAAASIPPPGGQPAA